MVRVCKNCGVAGHNIRTCTQPMKPQAPPSPPKKRGRPKGSKNKPKTVPSPAPTPTLAPAKEESVIVEPQAVAMPTMPTTQKMVNGVDISGMEVINKNGVTQYKTKKGTFIIFPEVNITRNESFLNVVRRVKEVVADRNRDGMKLVFKVKELRRDESAITNPPTLRAAQKGLISGSYERPIGSGNYYWETVIYQIEHSEFEDPKFEFIGTIQMTDDDAGVEYGNWDFKAKFYPRHATDSPKALGGSKAWQEYEELPDALYYKLSPQIKELQDAFMEHSNAMGKEKFPNGQTFPPDPNHNSKRRFKGSCYCYKCNPKGDGRWRQSADLYLTKEEIKSYKVGQLGSDGYITDIPKGTLIPLGDGCEYSVNPIDIELISSLYGNSRRIAKSQNIWQNPYSIMGWGFAVMDIRSYLTRVFSFYNKKLDTAMKLIESQGKLPFLIPDSTVLEGGITYKSLNPYALEQYTANQSNREAYNKLAKDVVKKLFPVLVNRGKYNEYLPEPKGVFDNKSSFLLEARYFEDKGVYWLQPAKAKDGGIEDFLEAYDLQKDDPEFFISVMQPIHNDDGELIQDPDSGIILEELVTLPNPEKLKELYALSGGIKEVYSPDDVKQDVEDAIAFLESIDVANMPPILKKYFSAYQITNPLVEVNNHSGVTKEKNSHKDAASIWSIYNIYKLEEKRKKAYDEYLHKALERKEQRSGMTLNMDFLDEKEQKIWQSIQRNLNHYIMTKDYITDVISSDDLDFVKEIKNNVQDLYNREGKEVPVIFYTTPVDWNKLEEIATIAKNAAKANQKVNSDARNLDSDILQIYRDGGGYYRSWKTLTPRTLDTQGEVYTNKEVFDLAGIDFNYTDEEVVKMDKSYGFSYAFFNSQGLVTRLLLNYDQLKTIKKYYEAKYMANLGVGQAPTAPTAPAPAPSASKNYPMQISSSKMGQLEREVKTTKFPLDNGEDVKGYVVAVSAKTYRKNSYNPFPKTKWIGIITANNDDDSLNGYYLNLPYPEEDLKPNSIERGYAVILDFKTGNMKEFYGRYQTSISKVNMRRD